MLSDGKEVLQKGTPVTVEELLQNRSAEQVEKDMIKASEAEGLRAAENMSPADRASMFFQALYDQWEHKLNGLSAKELRRLCAALVHYPLEDTLPKTEQGQEALYMGLRLTDAKLVMRETIVMEERVALQEKEQAEAKAIADSAVTTFETGEAVSGI